MKNKWKNLIKSNLKNESGSVVMIFLIVFLAMVMFFLGLYSLVYSDYLKSTSGIDKLTEYNKQSNIVETVGPNYKQDMLNDIDYDEMELVYGYEEPYKTNFKLEYNNYKFKYIKGDEKDVLLDEDEIDKKYPKGTFGRFDWVHFKNYNDIEIPLDNDTVVGNLDDYEIIGEDGKKKVKIIREYAVSDNWKLTGDEKTEYYKNGSLLVRVPLYVQIHFGAGVDSIELSLGGNSYNLINRGNTSNIYKLENVPYGISMVTVESTDEDVKLGSTSLSILRGREIDVEVYNTDKLKNTKNKVLTKTINIELGTLNNYIYFD